MRSLPQAVTENIFIASTSLLTSSWFILLSDPGARNPSSQSVTLHILEFQVNGVIPYRLGYVWYPSLRFVCWSCVSGVHPRCAWVVLRSVEFVSPLFWDTSSGIWLLWKFICLSIHSYVYSLLGNSKEGGDEVTQKVYVSHFKGFEQFCNIRH